MEYSQGGTTPVPTCYNYTVGRLQSICAESVLDPHSKPIESSVGRRAVFRANMVANTSAIISYSATGPVKGGTYTNDTSIKSPDFSLSNDIIIIVSYPSNLNQSEGEFKTYFFTFIFLSKISRLLSTVGPYIFVIFRACSKHY